MLGIPSHQLVIRNLHCCCRSLDSLLSLPGQTTDHLSTVLFYSLYPHFTHHESRRHSQYHIHESACIYLQHLLLPCTHQFAIRITFQSIPPTKSSRAPSVYAPSAPLQPSESVTRLRSSHPLRSYPLTLHRCICASSLLSSRSHKATGVAAPAHAAFTSTRARRRRAVRRHQYGMCESVEKDSCCMMSI
jgi:hypothetical protein